VNAFDVDSLLSRLERWCETQAIPTRLVRQPPMTEAEIDRIPSLLERFPFPLPTPYDPARFVLPQGYRALLARAGGLHVEYTQDDEPEVWPVVQLFTPRDCSSAHCGDHDTLCDAWSTAGTTLDDREITTTDLVSFASAGFSVEASRWCFRLGGGGPLPIHLESNDYECECAWYVDTGEPVSEVDAPVFTSFEAWFTALVDEVTSRPLDPEGNDALIQRLFDRGEASPQA
jgi:hypothetical protein